MKTSNHAIAAHTAGDWIVSPSNHPGAGLLIKTVPGPVIAQCDTLPEMEANAHLMAAAPELLAALEEAEDLLHFASLSADPSSAVHEKLAKARAAIAKARQ